NIDILIDLLSDTYEVLVALDGESVFEIVEENRLDLILLDIMMPYMDGYEVCRRLKLNRNTKDIPIIFITAKTDEASIERAYDVGGFDYVTKPFKPKELRAKVKLQLQLQKLIKELEASQKELKFLASTDPMTELYNRRYFSTISKHILDLAKRDATPTSIIMLDIDNFKKVNDTYGHKVGDDVIISLAKLLQKFTRKSDIACRFGGEEFVILLPETAINGASVIAEKIREATEHSTVNSMENNTLTFTISLGIAQIDPEEESDIEASIHRADTALYAAKRGGKNRVYIKNDKGKPCKPASQIF
ncbi:MAG: diguanylate cyclase response regulator, partial [Epsilonproteobacteria bacterium]